VAVATAPELTCQELVKLVTAYLEGALTADERARFEAHLALCAGCQGYVDQLRETIRLTGTLNESALRPQVREDLLGVFRAWRDEG
jgi:anti-sigma factor RsiW